MKCLRNNCLYFLFCNLGICDYLYSGISLILVEKNEFEGKLSISNKIVKYKIGLV